MSKNKFRPAITVLLAAAGSLLLSSAAPVMGAGTTLTIIQLQDLHGNLLPHAGVIQNPDGSERYVTQGGGVAKAKTLVDQIRDDNSNNLLLAVGDSTQGSAEVLYTVGDAIMPAMNAFGIDAFTPGNWDFGYGPAVFRNRFTSFGPKPTLPANIQVMSQYVSCADIPDIPDVTDDPEFCTEITATQPFPTTHGVIKANFPTVAVNVYNDATSAPLPGFLHHTRVLKPYEIFERDGVKIAVIGITASIVPQQPDVFNIGLRFTQGTEELPGIIADVQEQGASIIIVQSELGLSANVQIAREFPEIDVMLSAHTHELTLGALLVHGDDVTRTTPGRPLSRGERKQLNNKNAAIVVESGEDLYLGRLDLEISNGQITDFTWEAIPVDDDVAEDADMKTLVDAAEEPFIAGMDGIVEHHTFMPGGFCTPPSPPNCGDTNNRGLQLVDSLDTVVGTTEVLLERHNVLEDIMNNFIADAIRATTDSVVATGVDVSMTNGFRFDVPILSANEVSPGQDFVDDRDPGQITLRDLYYYFPISPATVVAEFSGAAIVESLEVVLEAVFDRNPYRQRGGWYLGLANMTQELDLDNRPFSSSGGRIVGTRIGTAGGLAGEPLDPSGRYVFASCYGHAEPVNRVCRTSGGSGHQFFQLADASDYSSAITLVDPVNSDHIVQVVDFPSPPPAKVVRIKQVAPDRYLHPVHMMRRYLDANGTITTAQFGTGRIQTVDSTKLPSDPNYFVDPPVSIADSTLVQPIQGAGPGFFARLIELFK